MIDADKIDLIKEIKEQKKLTGQERGVDIKYLVKSVKERWGDEGYNRVIQELEKNGYKMPDVSKYDDMEWIPWHVVNIFFLGMIKVFNLQEDEIVDIARGVATSPSPIVKLYVKYFANPEKTIKYAAKRFRTYYSQGEMALESIDKEHKEIVLRIKDIKRHPYACIWDVGSIGRALEIATGWKIINQTETKCMFKGDPYHEFVYRFN